MRLHLAYRLLCHLTLGLAAVCLVQAEAPFLPALPACLPPYLAFVALAFLTEGRWALPAWGANVLGLLIGAGTAWWVLWQLDEPGWAQDVGPAAALVPSLGPVLMALTLVKLFRPREHGHFWLLQGMGLIQAGLGCILATDPAFGFLLTAYVAAGLGCLALHQQTGGRIADAGRGVYLPRGWLPRFILRWAPAVGATALVLFLLTPRGDGSGWDAFRQFGTRRDGPLPPAGPTGFDVGMNLNRVGEVEVEDEVALTVHAIGPDGQPKLDLPADQRWRGVVLDRYEHGVWTSWLMMPHGQINLTPHQRRLPDFGPGQWHLEFTVEPRRAGGLFLAEPVRLGDVRHPLPVESLDRRVGPPDSPLFQRLWGTVVPLPGIRREVCHYRQVLPAGGDPGRSQARGMESWYTQRLLMQDLPGLGSWTNQQLHRLTREPRYGLTRLTLPAPGEAPDPADWEKVACALCDYLGRSGEYAYSLDLYRQDTNLDPVLDFLWNVKQGHCERFAAALTLMLRSVGIPARVVKGFHGADSQGDGTYTVRQSHAHAWVEALVPSRGPTPYDWITLDPTPSAGPLPERTHSVLARWWENARRGARAWWRDLILGYNSSFRTNLLAHLGGTAGLQKLVARAQAGLLIVLGLAGLWWAVGRLRRRRRSADAGKSRFLWYARLRALLERHGLGPRPSQTPREFGAAARQALLALPVTAPLADVPAAVAELLYRAAFGGRPLTDDESRTLASQLDRLEAALRGGRRSGFPA